MWCVYINRTSKEAPFTFPDLLNLQENVLKEIHSRKQSALLFAEVSPVVTLGARQVHDDSQSTTLAQLKTDLENLGVSLVGGGRGGKETWHGPGQWVVFILTPLEKFSGDPRGVRKAVCLILDQALETVRSFCPEARIEEGERLGIWSSTGKLVSVGIKIREGYVTSGFALNCIPTEHSFAGIDPCGLAGDKADFLFQHRLKVEQWSDAFERLPAQILSHF